MNMEPDSIENNTAKKNPSGRKPWKVIIPIACALVLAVIILLLATVLRGGFYIRTETSGGFITAGKVRTYYVTGIPSLKFKVADNVLESRMRETEIAKEEAYFEVTATDPRAFKNGKYDVNYDLVFLYGDCIYYHGERGSNVFYEYNRLSGKVRDIPLKADRGYLIGTDKTMMENISVLALVSIYPDFEKEIKKRNGTIWYVFYDERDGRIFYEQGGYIYEYIPKRKKSRLVYRAGVTNVRAVYSKR